MKTSVKAAIGGVLCFVITCSPSLGDAGTVQEDRTEQENHRSTYAVTNSFSTFTVKDLIDWAPGAFWKNRRTASDEINNKPVQIISIHPHWRRITLPANMAIPPDLTAEKRRKPAWYGWLNPRLFLAQWGDFWTIGTDATPVVLVSFKF